MTEEVRVRYAPSPTGFPHVGNIRTALFNWLFARSCGGKFIVRIEDTDVARTVPGAVENILDSLKWLGIDWDEGPEVGGDYGPYFQSQRLDIYQAIAKDLVAKGYAYYCHCSSERLAEMRAAQEAAHLPPGYDRHCRDLGLGDAPGAVIRLKVPDSGTTTFHDLIRGDITFENRLLDDMVLLKSDGYPTYHLANVIDDHLMHITHVMRAEEWISSTPRHIMLYNALGFEPPKFAHMPMILGPDHSKLSKRHGSVSLTEYREQGYLPETMINFLSLLGWSYDDKTEIMTSEEIQQRFSIERINPTSAVFDKNKLDWMNGVYIRQLSEDELVDKVMPVLEKNLPESVKRPIDRDYVRKVMPLMHERLKTLQESALPETTWFFFTDDISYDAKLLPDKKLGPEGTLDMLKTVLPKLEALEDFTAEPLEALLRPLAAELGLKAGQVFAPIRTAVSGLTATPPLFGMMEVLGKDKCIRRIREAIKILENEL
jgi:glutamyl-tRNA synthetase